jgi:hypothetical protein
MGAFKGGLTVKRFRVDGDPPDGFKDAYVKAMTVHAFTPLAPEDEEDRKAGWVVCGRLLDTVFDVEKVFWNEYVVMTYRVDSLRIPSAVMAAHVLEREEAEVAARGQGGAGLSRDERDGIKQDVRRTLRKRMLPAMKGIDVVWNLDTGTLFVWTHNVTLLEDIEDLFLRTFRKVLLPEDPFSMAERSGWADADGDPLRHVEPADFN